jgi:hypothetical protein
MEEQKQKTQADYEQAMLGTPDEKPIDPKGFYYVDFDKITKAEDIVAILAAVNFSFIGSHPRVHLVAHLLDRANVQYPKEDQYGQSIVDAPKLKQIKLPKKIELPKRGKSRVKTEDYIPGQI